MGEPLLPARLRVTLSYVMMMTDGELAEFAREDDRQALLARGEAHLAELRLLREKYAGRPEAVASIDELLEIVEAFQTMLRFFGPDEAT